MTRAEILDCLTDRPCDYCKFHESGRCERWNCVFEEKPDEMTREEAIGIMCVIVHMLEEKYDTDMVEDAVDLAIKALSAEPCEDCISRQAVLDGIEELKKSPWATDKRDNGSEYLIKEALEVVADLCVKKAPSVTPKQKMGHWIDYQKNRWIYAQCSECGTVHDTKTNYCHNCGVKMEVSENE